MRDEPDTAVMTVEQLEWERAARKQACHDARDVLFGLEHEVLDVLVVADWLLTGEAALALQLDQQSVDRYSAYLRATGDDCGLAPDAATWRSVDSGGSGG